MDTMDNTGTSVEAACRSSHLLSIICYPLSVICRHRRPGPLSVICRHRRPGPLSAICRFDGRSRRSGFTLIELLVVIAVIAILATVTTGAAQYAIRTSRQKRFEVSCRVLETAIVRYKTEYGKWPGTYSGDDTKHQYLDEDNADVFGMLRVGSDDNEDEIAFLDETAFFTEGAGGNGVVSLNMAGSGPKPLVFQGRNGKWKNKDGKYFYHSVHINYEDEEVNVPALKASTKDWKGYRDYLQKVGADD